MEVPSQGDADADVQSSPPGIVFHPASAIDEAAVAQVQTDLRRRILRYCARPPFAMGRLRKEGATLVPPPRTHRHRYFGVLTPNLPLRAAAAPTCTA